LSENHSIRIAIVKPSVAKPSVAGQSRRDRQMVERMTDTDLGLMA